MKTTDEIWNQTKRHFINNWTALNDEDLERTKGDKAALIELLQQKFSISYQQAAAAVSEIMPQYKNLTSIPGTEKPDTTNVPLEIKRTENNEHPSYPNKLYEEELPPDIKLDDMD